MTIRVLSYMLGAGMLLAACAQDVNHGHLKEDEMLGSVHPGTTTKDDTLKLLGSPSSQSSFGPSTWYYISSVQKMHSLLAPTIVDQHIIEVAFDSAGVVSSVKEYNMSDAKDVQVASRVTPSEGQTLGFFEQILSNLGRFNKDKGSSISNNHGSGLPPVVR